MRWLATVMFLIVGLIHLLPLSGVMGAEQLENLYGTALDDPSLVLLMRHRAVLFGLLGAFFCAAAFKTEWQGLALIAGFISVISFLLLEMMVPSSNAKITRVALADWVALSCLVIAGFAWWRGLKIQS